MNAAAALFDLPATDATIYVDPFPGLKGSDRVWEKCYCDNGVYTAPSRVHWNNGNGDTTWCFRCEGNGGTYVLVSSVRARVRRTARNAQLAAEQAAAWEAGAAAREAAEQAARAAAVAAEQARRAAMVQGFIAEVGDKVKDITATVTMAKGFESPSFRGYGTDYKMLVVLTADNGQVIKTFGTGASLFDLHKGDVVTVSGTVKDHDRYDGQDQTILTRTKVTKSA